MNAIPHNALCLFLDGDSWCCVYGDFINLQESPAGFGNTIFEAMENLWESNKADLEKKMGGEA